MRVTITFELTEEDLASDREYSLTIEPIEKPRPRRKSTWTKEMEKRER
jgi:hypothetical protein